MFFFIQLLEGERRSWETKIVSLESEYRNKTIMLERELQKQRERVATIIKEKEKRLTDLQQSCSSVFQLSDNSLTSDVKIDLHDTRLESYVVLRSDINSLILFLEL